jgi:tRNA (guanosine-2'-O-)-methyltransferase
VSIYHDRDSLFEALADLRGIVPGRTAPEIDGEALEPAFVEQVLREYVTGARQERIEAVLAGRTRTVTTVVEGIVNVGNVSAVMRTAEALGFQDLHVITGEARFKNSSRTSIGAERWLDVYHWESPEDCVQTLRRGGYRILATHLDDTAKPIEAFDFREPTAIVLGNERDGISEQMQGLADERVILPMAGFAQSFNISVAAAIALYHAYLDRIRRAGRNGDLTDDEKQVLRAVYYMNSVRAAEGLLRRAVREKE